MESFEKPSRPSELFGSDVLTNVSSSMYKTRTKDEVTHKSVVERDSDMFSSISSSLSECDQSSLEHQKKDFANLKGSLKDELQRLKDIVKQLNEETSGDSAPKTVVEDLEIVKYEKMLEEKRVQAEMYLEKLMKIENENCSIRGRIELFEFKAKSNNNQLPCCNCLIF